MEYLYNVSIAQYITLHAGMVLTRRDTVGALNCSILFEQEIDAPNHFANMSATVYRSESVLYSKRTVGSPVSSHIKFQ